MIKGYFSSLPADRSPNTLACSSGSSRATQERFEFGLEVLVKGLAAASES